MRTHSEKGLDTLRAMGCTVAGWSVPPIRWEIRTIDMMRKVKCETCHGRGRIYPSGANQGAQCTTCQPSRARHAYGTGYVFKMLPTEVQVGIIEWVPGTLFDSRMRHVGHGSNCDLCGKHISKSGFIPVHAPDASGQVHGMWIGTDCAKAILGVKIAAQSMEEATAGAKATAAARRMVRDIPKPPKPVKPAKPALAPDAATKDQLDTIVAEEFGAWRTGGYSG